MWAEVDDGDAMGRVNGEQVIFHLAYGHVRNKWTFFVAIVVEEASDK
jgi:hypothetical protein